MEFKKKKKNEFKKLRRKNELGYRHRKFKKRQNVEILGYRRRNQNYGTQKKENRWKKKIELRQNKI